MNPKLKPYLIFLGVFLGMSLFEITLLKGLKFNEMLYPLLMTNILFAGLWVLGYSSMKNMK